MSERTPKRKQPHVTFGPKVVYSEEEGKRLYEEARRIDNGTAMIVQNVIYAIEDRPDLERNLIDVVVRLIGHMTPDQQRGLAERLAGIAPTAANGATHSAAG